jgi:ribose-phosphate pyrophosphokinase
MGLQKSPIPTESFNPKEPLQPAGQRTRRPAPDRKRTRNLSEDKRFKLFSGTANRPLAEEIARHIGVTVGEAKIQRFADGEIYFQSLENVRGVDVFVVQPTCYPVDQHLVELLVMIDALKRASAARITVVVPYYGYARQDRKDKQRVPISAKLVADLLTTAGANRALFVDLHAAQIQGFFNIPVDHLFASPVLVGYFRELNLPNLIVVSPDRGWRGAGALLCAEDRRAPGYCGQAPHRYERCRGDECDWRRGRQELPHPGRHGRHRRHAGEDRRRTL